jgi:hypothetical protein
MRKRQRGNVGWIHLPRDTNQWQILVNTLTILQLVYKAVKYLHQLKNQ